MKHNSSLPSKQSDFGPLCPPQSWMISSLAILAHYVLYCPFENHVIKILRNQFVSGILADSLRAVDSQNMPGLLLESDLPVKSARKNITFAIEGHIQMMTGRHLWAMEKANCCCTYGGLY